MRACVSVCLCVCVLGEYLRRKREFVGLHVSSTARGDGGWGGGGSDGTERDLKLMSWLFGKYSSAYRQTARRGDHCHPKLSSELTKVTSTCDNSAHCLLTSPHCLLTSPHCLLTSTHCLSPPLSWSGAAATFSRCAVSFYAVQSKKCKPLEAGTRVCSAVQLAGVSDSAALSRPL